MYESGVGFDKDAKQAASWYRKAGESGFTPAQLNLGSCTSKAKGSPRAKRRALEWIKEGRPGQRKKGDGASGELLRETGGWA